MFAGCPQVGRTTVNKQLVPVYVTPSGDRFVATTDAGSGRTVVLSVEGAKTFKRGQVPFAPAVRPVLDGALYADAVPFALRSEAQQQKDARTLLKALMGRVIDSGVSLSHAEN